MSDQSRATPAQETGEGTYPRGAAFALTACVGLACVPRVLAALNDPWFDEIWSIKHSGLMQHWWHVFTRIHHDNNHHLNTLYIHLLGQTRDGFWYRLPSIVLGSATVALAGWAALRRDFVEVFIAMILVGFSYPLVLYSSEARGFAPAVFFALSAWIALRSHQRARNPWALGLFWASVVLGFLSHLTYIHFYLSSLVWCIVHETNRGANRRAVAVELLKGHAVPVVFLVFLNWIDARHLVIGGGPIYEKTVVLRRAVSMAMGTPERGLAHGIGLAGFIALLAGGILALSRQKSDQRWFFLFVLLLAPGIILLLRRPQILFFRYFVVCLPFFYLLAGHVLAAWHRRGHRWRILTVVLLVLFLAGNVPRIERLVALGRGQYREAVRMMAEQTGGPEIVVGTDGNFGDELLLDYYQRFLPEGKRIRRMGDVVRAETGPEWFIQRNQDPEYRPPSTFRFPSGWSCTLVWGFPYAGVSGWEWFVYRNDEATANENGRE